MTWFAVHGDSQRLRGNCRPTEVSVGIDGRLPSLGDPCLVTQHQSVIRAGPNSGIDSNSRLPVCLESDVASVIE